MDLPLRTLIEKKIHAVETHWVSGKEKVCGNLVSKGGHADSLLGFPRKVITVKSAYYCQLFRQNSTYLVNNSDVYIYIYIVTLR